MDNRENFVAMIRQFLYKMEDKTVLRMNIDDEILNVTKNGEFDPTWNLHVDKLVQIANEVRKNRLMWSLCTQSQVIRLTAYDNTYPTLSIDILTGVSWIIS